jgi:cell division protein FtsZ
MAARTEPVLRDPGYTQPILTQNAATPAAIRKEPVAAEASADARIDGAAEPVAAAAESAALRSGAFIAPKPAEAGPPRPVPLVQPAAAPAAEARPKTRTPSLIERVTGIGRARPAAAPPMPRPTAPPPAAPAKSAQQPRLTPLEPDQKPGLSKEDDLLDIPAFLRRQAN